MYSALKIDGIFVTNTQSEYKNKRMSSALDPGRFNGSLRKKAAWPTGLGREVNREEKAAKATRMGGIDGTWPQGRHWGAPLDWYRDPA